MTFSPSDELARLRFWARAIAPTDAGAGRLLLLRLDRWRIADRAARAAFDAELCDQIATLMQEACRELENRVEPEE